jgi:hypothetical protein
MDRMASAGNNVGESHCVIPEGLQALDRATCIGEFDVLCD